MTTFNKLLAVKEGGGNPGAPGSADSLNLAFADFDAAVTSFDLTASNNLLVAFDAASLDFGNAGANPAFNFLGAGDFAVDGDSWFKATGGNSGDPDFQVDGYAKFLDAVELQGNLGVGGNLSVTGTSNLTGNVSMAADASITSNLTVSGTSAFTGNVSMTNDLLVSGNGTVNGNLTIKGSLVTKGTESLLISDNYGDMNSDYTAVSPQDAGFTFNYSPIENKAISSFSANEITVASAFANAAAGDFILVAGLDAGLEANEGIYQIDSINGSVISIVTAPTLTFVKSSISAAAQPGNDAKAALINLAVIRTSDQGELQWAIGKDATLSFGNVPFDGYVGGQYWSGSFALNKGANDVIPFAVYDETGAIGLLKIDTAITAVATKYDLFIDNNNGADDYALALGEVSADPGVGSGVGKVYAKSMTTNNVAIDELFYVSMIGQTHTPVQITKNGALNIDVLTFPLQEAYLDGNTIDISENNRPLSITNSQQYAGYSLEVSGSTNLQGSLAASGAVSLTSNSGTQQSPDFSVAGISQLTGAVYAQGLMSVGSTLGVTGAATLSDTLSVALGATLSSTLDVTGAATFLSTLDVTGAVDFDSTLSVAGVLTALDDLSVTGNGGFGGSISASGATIGGTLNVTGAATLSDTLAVTGAATLSSTLGVTGAATLSSTLDVTGTSTLGVLDAGSTTLDDLTVSGSSSLAGMSASGAATFLDTVSITGAATLSSTLDVSGNATFALAVTANGTLTAENNLVVNGDYIRIAEAASFSAPAADTGSVYVSADPAAATHAELWYHGDGTANAVMITKNGQLNIDVLTFSLQAAYDDGASITTSVANGPVSISDGTQGAANALEVTGNVSVTGDFATTGPVTSGASLTVLGSVSVNNNAIDVFTVDGANGNTDIAGTLGVSGLSTLDSLAVTNNASVGGTFGATGAATLSDTLAVTGAATLSSTLAVTGNITASADLEVDGILNLDGSVDADVSAFDLLSSGDVSIKASGILSLKGPAVAANLAETAGAAIASGELVMMTANGLGPAIASSQNAIVLGAALAAISANASSEGLVAEFGSAVINAEANLTIAKGDRLYLSAATAGAVTNVEPSAAGSSVFQVGVALEAANNAASLKVALRPQFMYNVF